MASKKAKVSTSPAVKKPKPTALTKAKEAPQPRKPLDVASVARIVQPGQRFARVVGSDPFVIASTLLAASNGDNEAYLSLATEIEERYLHAASLLQTRRGAVTGEDIEVEPGEDSDVGRAIADLFRKEVVEQPQFDSLVINLLDALMKGYAVAQPHWDTTGPLWRYAEFEFVDQRFFIYDRDTLSQLRMRQEGSPDGVEIPPGQFIIHRPNVRPGIPVRAGLARPCAIAWLFHATTIKQWATLIDVYGMPVRIGRYTPGIDTTAQELEELRTALVNIGHDAAAMIPNTMQVEVLDARRPSGGGENIYSGFADYMDKQCSKLILGGTMLSDAGSSLSQSQTHDKVRQDIKAADIKALNATLSEQVAKPWCLYNFGPNAPAPRIAFNIDPPEDLKSLSEALVPLINAGLKVRASDIRQKFGLEDPEDGDELIEKVSAPVPPALGGLPNNLAHEADV